MTPIEWAGIGAGALAFIASLLPWYSYSFDAGVPGFSTSGSLSAWGVGILGWLPVLMLVAAGVIVLLPHLGNAVANATTIWLGLAGGAVVLILIRWLTLPDDGGLGGLAGSGYSSGAGFGLIVGLLAAVASAVAAFLTFQASKKAVPPPAA
ncbi:MAG TPA: hypothetical protein VM677_12090 [Actinokineospora sp.]|nr:hypothetical protein [Actinokineospora sp.]